MVVREQDQRVLEGLAAARAQHEELADLLDFYLELHRVQFEAKAELQSPESRDALAKRWRLEGGIPQVTFDQLGIEAQSFGQLVERIAAVLLRHNPTWQFNREGWTPEQMISRAQQIYESWDTLTAPKSEPVSEQGPQPWATEPMALAVGFALAPYLQQAADAIMPHLDQKLWAQGHCPICGGRPNLALLEKERGARRLMCSRCSSLWEYSRIGCPFCRSREKQTYYASQDGLYRLYVCPSCNSYLKTVDLREVHREIEPMVERLLTVGMDLAARQEGFGG